MKVRVLYNYIVIISVLSQNVICGWIPARWVDDKDLERWYQLLKQMKERGLSQYITIPPSASTNAGASNSGKKVIDLRPRFQEEEETDDSKSKIDEADCGCSSKTHTTQAKELQNQYLSCGCPINNCSCHISTIPKENEECNCESCRLARPPLSTYEYDPNSFTTQKPILPCGCSYHSPDSAEESATTPNPLLQCGCPYHQNEYVDTSYIDTATEKLPIPKPKLPCGCSHHEPDTYIPLSITRTPPPYVQSPHHICQCEICSPTHPKPLCNSYSDTVTSKPPSSSLYHAIQPTNVHYTQDTHNYYVPSCQKVPPIPPCIISALNKKPSRNYKCRSYCP